MQGQLIGVALSFLRNFGIFSGASGVLGALSRGVAAIGTDKAAQEVLSPPFSDIMASLYLLCLSKGKKVHSKLKSNVHKCAQIMHWYEGNLGVVWQDALQ